jgi:hypothetical protein
VFVVATKNEQIIDKNVSKIKGMLFFLRISIKNFAKQKIKQKNISLENASFSQLKHLLGKN